MCAGYFFDFVSRRFFTNFFRLFLDVHSTDAVAERSELGG